MNRTFFAPALFAAFFCLTALLPREALASDYRTSMEVAQGDFESGEFENALAELANALQATDDHRALCAVHLMRAR
ncbi:MAG: hypothetical protein IJC63_07560, partial [Myxococcaceae bacterium]|nr:hypothetical protein [Myxococcaceae bacterium]